MRRRSWKSSPGTPAASHAAAQAFRQSTIRPPVSLEKTKSQAGKRESPDLLLHLYRVDHRIVHWQDAASPVLRSAGIQGMAFPKNVIAVGRVKLVASDAIE